VPTIRILICSPIRLYGEGLAKLLAGDRFEVVGAAVDPHAWASDAERVEPEVVLVDLAQRETVEAVRPLARTLTGATLVALSIARDERTVVECAQAGVTAFIAREATVEELRETVLAASAGESPAPPWLVAMLLRRVSEIGNGTEHSAALLGRLTRREREVLALVADGLSNKQIGRRLCIELPTVKNHVHNILEKLEVNRRAEAVAQTRRW